MKSSLPLLLVVLLLLSLPSFAQKRQKSNWVEDKKSHIARWRIGAGINASEPAGIHIQIYRLKGICTKTIRIRKRLSVDAFVGKEGLIFPNIISRKNPTWLPGGYRASTDFRFHFPIALNPYVGAGCEFGQRRINGTTAVHTDAVVRVGIEQKLFGARTSPSSMIHSSLFVEGKYNHGISLKFSYFAPNFGLRFHFL